MLIGELSRRTGVSTKTIRYYEDVGVLLPPDRTDNGYRDYTEQAIDRLMFVRDARATGLSLAEISYIFDLRQKGVGTCEHVIGLVDRHLADLDQHIAALKKTRKQLDALKQRASNLDPADCNDPNRCQTIAPGVVDVSRRPKHAKHLSFGSSARVRR